MGSAVGHVLARGGARVVTTLAGRSVRTAGLAGRARIECLPGLVDVVRESEIVISIAPPEHAESIGRDLAGAAAEAGRHPLLADLNAISPATVRRMAGSLTTAGLDLVDGSVSGPPPWRPDTTRIYLSGRGAPELASIPFPGVELIIVGEEVGTASAVKMCTASVYKGTTALLLHALATARANGVLHHVLDDLADSLPQLTAGIERTLARAATKSGRYVAEMREIAATQAAAGLPAALFEGIAEVYEEVSRRPLARQAVEDLPEDPALEETLAALMPDR